MRTLFLRHYATAWHIWSFYSMHHQLADEMRLHALTMAYNSTERITVRKGTNLHQAIQYCSAVAIFGSAALVRKCGCREQVPRTGPKFLECFSTVLLDPNDGTEAKQSDSMS